MKNRWLFSALLVVVLTIGISGGVVLAQGGGNGSDSPLKGFVSRVAAILGMQEAEVQGAVDQAAMEMQDDALQQRLDRAVENGTLDQDQADEYMQRYQSRPESIFPEIPFGKFGSRGLGGELRKFEMLPGFGGEIRDFEALPGFGLKGSYRDDIRGDCAEDMMRFWKGVRPEATPTTTPESSGPSAF